MITSTTYRKLVLAFAAALIAPTLAGAVFGSGLPASLAEEVSRVIERRAYAMSGSGMPEALLASAGVLIPFAGVVGLYLFKTWGIWLSVLGLLVSLGLSMHLGFSVSSGVSNALQQISNVLLGVILATAWFTDVRESFRASS